MSEGRIDKRSLSSHALACSNVERGGIAVSATHTYDEGKTLILVVLLDLAEFAYSIVLFDSYLSLLFHSLGASTLDALLEDERYGLTNRKILASTVFLVYKGAKGDNASEIHVMDCCKMELTHSSPPEARPMNPKPFSAFHRYQGW